MLDTGILIAALITRDTPPDQLYQLWRKRRFTLLSMTRTTISCLPLRSPALLVVVSASEIGPFTVMVSVFTWPVTGSFIGTALVMERREMSSRSG